MTDATYQQVIKAVGEAVALDQESGDKWEKAGPIVAKFYGSAQVLEEAKVQFIADAIAPKCKKKHADALKVDLPRKNGKEYLEKVKADPTYPAKWEDATQAKKDARSTYHTMYARVLKYAFPKPAEDTTANPPKTLKTKLIDALSDCIGKIEKAENPDFDAVQALVHLRTAVAVIAK